MNLFRRAFRRWLFRRTWPQYKNPAVEHPVDGQAVVVLDDSHPTTPVWIAEYDATNNSYEAGHGWFEPDEIVYWAPVRGPDRPITREEAS